jgi:Holliday junction resolvase RusA-like endonuclease
VSDELLRIKLLVSAPHYVLEVPLPMAFKQRPRMTKSGHAYMATSYKSARQEFRSSLRAQWSRPILQGPVGLYLKVRGEARGDADNLAGFFMDAAGPLKTQNEAGILWEDDRLKVIPLLIVDWAPAPKKDSMWEARILELEGLERE